MFLAAHLDIFCKQFRVFRIKSVADWALAENIFCNVQRIFNILFGHAEKKQSSCLSCLYRKQL